MKRRIAFGVLSIWAILFCLSFCDELGFWVDAGHAADHAVEQILASPGIKLSSGSDHMKDKIQNGTECDVVVSVLSLNINPNDSFLFIQKREALIDRPPLFQIFSRFLI